MGTLYHQETLFLLSEMMVLTPLWNNICCVLATLVCTKVAIEAASCMYYPKNSRLLLHLSFSFTLFFWPMYDTDDWSWRLNAVVPGALAARYLYKGLVVRDPTDEEVLLISQSPIDLCLGPLQLFLLLIWLGLSSNLFRSTESAVLVAAVGIGDGLLAPWVGARFGRHIYRTPLARNAKTMEGSLCGVFLGTILGSYVLLWGLGLPFANVSPRVLLAYSAIAATVEATAPGNMDNVVVPLVLHLSMERVKEWLPDSNCIE